MKRFQSLFWMLFVLLMSACAGQELQPSPTPFSTQTKASVTLTPTQTLIPAIPPTPIVVIPPYQTKQIVLDYYEIGWHTSFDGITDWSHSDLVLYSDGQMIIAGKTPYQKILSSYEVDDFMSQIRNLGFFEIVSNQAHDETDLLYDFEGQYETVYDDLYDCVLIRVDVEKELCASGYAFEEFLIPKMKKLLKFLNEYKPNNMSLYVPDRILLEIEPGRPSYYLTLPENSIPWGRSLPSLETDTYKILYAENTDAAEIFNLFGNKISTLVFSQDGKEYTVGIHVVFPHEVLSRPK